MGRARLLVLGSFPSIRSMEKGEYYGHQRNHFWPLLALVAGLPEAPSTYDARSALAASLGLLIWDMVATCSRRTSSDNDLIIHQLNDIQGLLAANPSLIRIGLNGGLASVCRWQHAGKIACTIFCTGSRAGACLCWRKSHAALWQPAS
ncbi:MAG: DNA-deoxyinosine glycosylase [Rectinemataceae bacterium]